jgi:hypothetical protein
MYNGWISRVKPINENTTRLRIGLPLGDHWGSIGGEAGERGEINT